ncbi:hypothetical protein M9H77_29752 [Catharanthus roseus]|uniref:Uncharacterized protein n=1 Tax=Catharanthus roseus TaxID=4058 RepID=A0ACB9ZX67_CATRO|nr:hypothetical protein M9H77_29752 [Catharanthus roseus]
MGPYRYEIKYKAKMAKEEDDRSKKKVRIKEGSKKIKNIYGNEANRMVTYLEEALKDKLEGFEDQGKASNSPTPTSVGFYRKTLGRTHPTASDRSHPTIVGRAPIVEGLKPLSFAAGFIASLHPPLDRIPRWQFVATLGIISAASLFRSAILSKFSAVTAIDYSYFPFKSCPFQQLKPTNLMANLTS